MQLRYVFSETGTGLRRNVSMTVALIVTMFVSLTLVGIGLLLNTQARKAEQHWGSRLQITVYLCNENSTPNCAGGEVTRRSATRSRTCSGAPRGHGLDYRTRRTSSRRCRSSEVAGLQPRDLLRGQGRRHEQGVPGDAEGPAGVPGRREAVQGLQGVDQVQDLHQMLQPIYLLAGG